MYIPAGSVSYERALGDQHVIGLRAGHAYGNQGLQTLATLMDHYTATVKEDNSSDALKSFWQAFHSWREMAKITTQVGKSPS